MKKRSYLRWLMLLLGAVAYVFYNGRWNVPLAAWIWPFCVLYYLHGTECRWEKAVPVVLLMAAAVPKWYGISAGTPAAEVSSAAMLGIVSFLPFAVEQLCRRWVRGFASTLILPLTFVSFEFLMSLTPVSTLDSVASTQTDGALIQLACLCGMYGITFLVVWFSSAALYVWENRSGGWREAGRPAVIYAGILAAVLLFGGLRTAFAAPAVPTVRCAVTTGIDIGDFTLDPELPPLEECIRSVEQLTASAAKGGAELVIFCEEAYTIDVSGREAMLTAAARAAAENDIDVLLPLEITDPNGLNENGMYYIDHGGRTVFHYVKNHLALAVEAGDYVQGEDGVPNVTVTLSGGKTLKLAAVICMDANFPGFIRDGVEADTQVLFVPAWLWGPNDGLQSRWLRNLSVENGVSVVSSVYDGYMTATDPYGRVLMSAHTDSAGYERAIFADVPAERVLTVYRAIGPVLDWLWVAALLALIVSGRVCRRKETKKET